jgi:hypothetical protein
MLTLALPLCAQDRIPDDSSRYRFLPTQIRIGTDLLAIGKGIYTDYFKGWEINVDADVYRRYYATVDYGSWSTNYQMNNGIYASDGRYFRVGVDINFLLKDPERNMFFVGVRRGHTNYRDYTDYSYTNPPFSGVQLHAENSNARANWNELTAGLRVRVWKFIWLGATGRIKFRYSGKGQIDLVSYDVPGYGKTFKTSWYGINYQIFFRIPVREDPKPTGSF